MTAPPPDHAMPFLLVRAFGGMVDEVHAQLAAAGYPGVRSTHGFALQALGEGCTSAELGRRLGVSKQAATKMVGGLVAMGLVSREPSERDRREIVVAITADGRRVLQLSGAAFADIVAGWRADYGDHAVDATLTTLASASASHPVDLSGWQ